MKVTRDYIRELKKLDNQIKVLNAEAKKMKDAIKEQAEKDGVTEYMFSEVGVRLTTVNSSRFNLKAFKEAFPDLKEIIDKYTEEVVTVRLNIK